MENENWKELLKKQEKERKQARKIKKEYDTIYQEFIEVFEKLSNLDVFRPTILMAHLYAGFYLNQMFMAMPIWSLDMFSRYIKDYEFLESASLSSKINFMNIMIPKEAKELKDLINELKELDDNRHHMVHRFEVKRLRLKGKRVKLSTENIRKINNHMKNLIGKLHKMLLGVIGIDNLTEGR